MLEESEKLRENGEKLLENSENVIDSLTKVAGTPENEPEKLLEVTGSVPVKNVDLPVKTAKVRAKKRSPIN